MLDVSKKVGFPTFPLRTLFYLQCRGCQRTNSAGFSQVPGNCRISYYFPAVMSFCYKTLRFLFPKTPGAHVKLIIFYGFSAQVSDWCTTHSERSNLPLFPEKRSRIQDTYPESRHCPFFCTGPSSLTVRMPLYRVFRPAAHKLPQYPKQIPSAQRRRLKRPQRAVKRNCLLQAV